jgi:hypothetical protein
MKKMLKYLAGRRVGLALTLGVPLLIIGWHLAVVAAQPRHLQQAATELGSVAHYEATPMS